jgi:hypothetical protein
VLVFSEEIDDPAWVPIDFKKLKRGAWFKLFEPDGTVVTGCHKQSSFMASSDAYLCKRIWSIEFSECRQCKSA